MSGIASQVILHPTASQTLNLWSTTVGRDKVSNLLLLLVVGRVSLTQHYESNRLTEQCNTSLGSWPGG